MQPALLMILSVLLFSLYPLLAVVGLRLADPILFIFMTNAGCAAFSFLGGWWLLRRRGGGKKLRAAFRLDRRTWTYVFATGTASAVNHACLMYAFLKIPPVSAAIIYETWPIMAAWLTPLLVVRGWQQVRGADYLFGWLAIIGIALIALVASRDALAHFSLQSLAALDPERLSGYGLAVIASIGVAISTTLRRNVTRHLREKFGDDLLLATYLSSGLTRLAALLPLSALLLALFGHTGMTLAALAVPLAVVTGIAVHLMGSVTYVLSIQKSPNPAIPVPDFIAPILEVTWLCLFFGTAGLTDIVILGGLFVITANLLVTVRAEDGFAYTASILTLLLGGTYCYFSGGALLDDYYQAVSVPALFYAILIAFAWDRALERTKREEALALEIAHGVEWLRRDFKGDGALLRRLVADIRAVLATTDGAAIGRIYRSLLKTRERLGAQETAVRLFQNLDTLILSKTKVILLSDIVLLCLIGGVTFFGILGFRPPGLWPDMMAFIMAGAIVFIFFVIFDQMNERNRIPLAATEESLGTLNNDLFQSRSEFKTVTILLIMIMLAVFYGLFRYKYAAPGP